MKHCPQLVNDTQEASSDSENSDGNDKKSRDDYDSYAYVSSQHYEAKQAAGSLTSPSKVELLKAHACFHCHRRVGHKVKQCPERSSAAFDRHDAEQYVDSDCDRPDEDDDQNSYGRDYEYENFYDNNNDEQYGNNKSAYGRDYYN